MRCENCLALKRELAAVLAQRDEALQQAAKATDLMMKGEALREKMMFESLLTTDEKKARAVYLLTGKRL